MTQAEKRLEELLRVPAEAKWDEVRQSLIRYGCTVEPPDGGSHWLVFHSDWPHLGQFTIPVHGNRIKKVYVRKLASLLKQITDSGTGRLRG